MSVHPWQRKYLIDKTCPHCGITSKRLGKSRVYCEACEKVTLTCKTCGDEFQRDRAKHIKNLKEMGGAYKTGPFCSRACVRPSNGVDDGRNFIRWVAN